MICNHCKIDLAANGLQSYGHNLEQSFCCVCWFDFALYCPDAYFDAEAFLEDEDLLSPFLNSLEDDGYHINVTNQPDAIMAWLVKTIKACDDDIASLRSEIDGVQRKRERLEEKRASIAEWLPDWIAKQKADVPKVKEGMVIA